MKYIAGYITTTLTIFIMSSSWGATYYTDKKHKGVWEKRTLAPTNECGRIELTVKYDAER